MKLPKKIVAGVIALVFVAGGVSAALVLQPTPEKPKEVAVKQVAAVKDAQVENEATVEAAPTQTTTASQPVSEPEPTPVPVPTPEENKARIEAEAEAFAVAQGYDQVDGPAAVFAQKVCVRKAILSSVGFGSYEAAKNVPIVQSYFAGNIYFTAHNGCQSYNTPYTNH